MTNYSPWVACLLLQWGQWRGIWGDFRTTIPQVCPRCVTPSSRLSFKGPQLRHTLTSFARPTMSAPHTGSSTLHFFTQVSPNTTLGTLKTSSVPSSTRGNSRTTTSRCMIPVMRRNAEPQGWQICCDWQQDPRMSIQRNINEHSFMTTVHICKSQDSYSISFHACALYPMSMVQKTHAVKQVHIMAAGVKLKNRDGTDQCLPLAKYLGSAYKILSLKKKEWFWQDCKKAKANGEEIPMAKKRCGQPPSQSRPNAWRRPWWPGKVSSVV